MLQRPPFFSFAGRSILAYSKSTCEVGYQFLKLCLRDGGGVYFSEGDIEGGERGLFGDCF